MHPQYTSAQVARFWAKVDRDGPVPEHRPELGPCWVWTAYCDRKGYGAWSPWAGKTVFAHRLAWELTNGPILDGLAACHACDRPACVNPAHLWLGTQQENLRDMWEKGRGVLSSMCERRGEANVNAKLTADDVRAIRAAYAGGGVSQQHLADSYGVHQGVVSLLIRRKTWAHID